MNHSTDNHAGFSFGSVNTLLRLEGAAALAVAVFAYAQADYSWTLFTLLFLAPDIAMLGYLANTRVGAATYNTFHTTLAPACALALGWFVGIPWLLSIGLIWIAHIGFDRAIGYGLKYPSAFKATHLGWK
jgi:hypothetical protein